MTPQSSSQLPEEGVDLAAQWDSALRLYPTYADMVREFAIEIEPCPDLEAGIEAPSQELVEQAQRWLNEIDEKIQVHQLRQFLQTSSRMDAECLIDLLQHCLRKNPKTAALRDKIDFLLVQYFSQIAPTELNDDDADLAYVAQSLESVLGTVEIKPPVWLNALHRVLDGARRCRSLNELLHGGILEQGRKAKAQAGDLFYMPISLVAFTRFGYLMRRVFFRLMHEDLNHVLEGLGELEEKGVESIDCRRAQFSEREPIIRLRMICQSWKVMFQAEYSSGQPLRMLVDLRASVDTALGQGTAPPPAAKVATAAPSASAPAASKAPVKARGAAASAKVSHIPTAKNPPGDVPAKPAANPDEVPEFEISGDTPQWNSNSES